MSRDTLLMLTTSFPEGADGSEAAGAFVADVAEELARSLPVRVVAPGRQPGEETTRNGVQVRRFASPGRPLSLLSPLRPTDWPAIVQTLASLRKQAFLAAADDRVAHTLALWALPSGWAARALERERGIPYSVWALGSDIWSLGRLPGVKSVLRGVLAGARERFADGHQLGDAAAAIAGKSFEFLPSTRRMDFVAPRVFRQRPPYRLLFLGRWHPNKGVDLLLDALERLDDGDWARIERVDIAGGGPLDAQVRAGGQRLAASGRPVVVGGFLGRDAAMRALADADYLLLPSRIESIPVVFSDALKAQCPVVASPVGDLPRFYGSKAPGVLAESVEAEAWAYAIRKALDTSPASFAEGMAIAVSEFSLVDRIAPRIRRLLAD